MTINYEEIFENVLHNALMKTGWDAIMYSCIVFKTREMKALKPNQNVQLWMAFAPTLVAVMGSQMLMHPRPSQPTGRLSITQSFNSCKKYLSLSIIVFLLPAMVNCSFLLSLMLVLISSKAIAAVEKEQRTMKTAKKSCIMLKTTETEFFYKLFWQGRAEAFNK